MTIAKLHNCASSMAKVNTMAILRTVPLRRNHAGASKRSDPGMRITHLGQISIVHKVNFGNEKKILFMHDGIMYAGSAIIDM